MNEFIKTHNEEQEDKTIWEYWLHRVFDQSLADFRESLKTETAAPTQEELSETIGESMSILNGFAPMREGEQNGTVQAAGDNSG